MKRRRHKTTSSAHAAGLTRRVNNQPLSAKRNKGGKHITFGNQIVRRARKKTKTTL